MVLGELPRCPPAELRARGPGADLIGRNGGCWWSCPECTRGVGELPHVRPRPAPARDLMERDLDQLGEQAEAYAGPVKVQAGGPFTLAAALELPIGGRLLRDPGAVRDLAGSLAEGLRAHVAAVARRLPRASVLLQLDEPSLPTVAGRAGADGDGLGAYRAVDSRYAPALLARSSRPWRADQWCTAAPDRAAWS